MFTFLSLGSLGVASDALSPSAQEAIEASLIAHLSSSEQGSADTMVATTATVVHGLAGTKFELGEELEAALVVALNKVNNPSVEFVTR